MGKKILIDIANILIDIDSLLDSEMSNYQSTLHSMVAFFCPSADEMLK